MDHQYSATFEVMYSTVMERDQIRKYLREVGGDWERLDTDSWNFSVPDDCVDEFTDLLDNMGVTYRLV